MDLQNPVTQKEDCELASFLRLSRRPKEQFPRLSFGLVADALYARQTVLAVCRELGGKYLLTIRAGRQPTTWQETIKLLPLHRENRLRLRLGTRDEDGLQDFRWVEDVLQGKHTTNVILSGEITPQAATLYAFITNYSNLTARRVTTLVNHAGRERHRGAEDTQPDPVAILELASRHAVPGPSPLSRHHALPGASTQISPLPLHQRGLFATAGTNPPRLTSTGRLPRLRRNEL